MLLRIYDHIREFCFIKVYYRKFEHCQYYVQCVRSQKDTVLKKLFVTFPKEQFHNIIIFLQVVSLSGRNIWYNWTSDWANASQTLQNTRKERSKAVQLLYIRIWNFANVLYCLQTRCTSNYTCAI